MSRCAEPIPAPRASTRVPRSPSLPRRAFCLRLGPSTRSAINGIRCDPATAEHIYTSPAGDNYFIRDGFRRFDEVLYQTPDGYWFLVRPLAPDEAEAWLKFEVHDDVLAQQLFPDDED
jgi:hypothetical protein